MKRICAIGLTVFLITAMFTGCRAKIEGETGTPETSSSSSSTNDGQNSSEDTNQANDNGVMDDITGESGRSIGNQPMQNMQ